MTKPFDTRQVEYAYINGIIITPNVGKPDNTYQTRITITYELKTADKELISLKAVDHYVDTVTKISSSQLSDLITANLDTFIATDKKDLSGFQQ